MDALETAGATGYLDRRENLFSRRRDVVISLVAASKRSNPQVAKRYPPYILARQIAALKKLSEDTDLPVQQHIRQAIDDYLKRRKKRRSRGSAPPSA
jgi:cytosine/adenosine deaminase-related metal-dependent hydrolase